MADVIAAGQRRESAFAGAVHPDDPHRARRRRTPIPPAPASTPLPPEPPRTCTRCGQPAGPFGAALCVDCGGEFLADVEFEPPDE